MFVEEHKEIKFETNRGRDAFIDELMEIFDKYISDDELDEVADLLDCSHYKQKEM